MHPMKVLYYIICFMGWQKNHLFWASCTLSNNNRWFLNFCLFHLEPICWVILPFQIAWISLRLSGNLHIIIFKSLKLLRTNLLKQTSLIRHCQLINDSGVFFIFKVPISITEFLELTLYYKYVGGFLMLHWCYESSLVLYGVV